MAARRKSRRVVHVIVPKLLPDTKVEVRSLEEGFLGSWHPGTVISGGVSTRNVKYDHLLPDDGTDSLTECVKVSSYVDGEDGPQEVPQHYRGIIRPFPPSLDSSQWSLHYGQCVDMNQNDAWWEGVIFDHEDGSEERKVFFPDMGDEVKAHVSTLRITQDWDEMFDNWKPRGNWLFLELIEDIEQKWPLLVSVKQIWYDTRLTGFEDIREWTNADRDTWRKWVSQVWYDNLKIAVKQVFDKLNSGLLQDHLLELRENDLDAILKRDAFTGNSFGFADSLKEHDTTCTSVPRLEGEVLLLPSTSEPRPCSPNRCSEILCVENGIISLSEMANAPRLEEEVFLLPSTSEPRPSSPNRCSEILCVENDKESLSKMTRPKIEWIVVAPDMLPQPGLYPDAVFSYSDGRSKKNELIQKIKGHLLSLNWKIYFNKDNACRLRYVTPEGVSYYSLREVCRLLTRKYQLQHPLPIDKQRSQPPYGEDDQRSLFPITQSNPESPASSDGLLATLKKKSKRVKKKSDVRVKPLKSIEKDGTPLFSRNAMNLCKGIEGPGLDHVDASIERQLVVVRDGSKGLLSDSHPTENPAEPHKTKDLGIRKRKGKNSGVADISFRRKKRHNVVPRLLHNEQSSQNLNNLGENGDAVCSTRVLRSSTRAVQEFIPSSNDIPRTVLSWLIDNNVVVAGEKVVYRSRKDSGLALIEGIVTRDGIKCCCCHFTFSIGKFAVHGGSIFPSPAANIFLEDGRSLFNCQLQLEQAMKFPSSRTIFPDANGKCDNAMSDYICSVCHDGGDLVLCDQCPSSYHIECIGLKVLPEGDWFCPSCCCGICGNKFDTKMELVSDDRGCSCSQCERQYHFRCVQDKGLMQNTSDLDGIWFCNKKCKKGLHQLLGKAVSVGHDNLTWTLVKYREVEDKNCDDHRDGSAVTTFGKLNVALSVMHECFLPIIEPLTQSDLIEDMIFCRRSELRRLSFQGFYTVLLEKNDELVTTATVRVYGKKLAEVPFVATRFQYRKNGMCRILMEELEKKLMQLGVERLVLPAVETTLDTWTISFGFSKMTMSDRSNFLSYTFLNFQGAILCQKLLQENISPTSSPTKDSEKGTFGNINEASLTWYIDGSSADSEVYQPDRVEDDEMYITNS